MPPRPTRPQLPQSLKDELERSSHPNGNQLPRPNYRKQNRKDARKHEREAAKKRKAYFMTGKVSKSTKQPSEPPPSKRQKVEVSTRPTQEPVQRTSRTTHRLKDKGKSSEVRDVRDFQQRSRVEEDEDAYIAALEARLGLRRNQSGKKHQVEFEEDGILDLLQQTDGIVPRNKRAGEVNGSPPKSNSDSDSSEEWGGFDLMDDDGGGNDTVPEPLQPVATTSSLSIGSSSKDDPRLQKLRRTTKGLLNRLSEQNMESIITEIEGLYRSHSRHDVTSTLTDIIIEGICTQSLLLDSFITIHAGVIACLYKIIGVEIGAHFLYTTVENFLRHYASAKKAPSEQDQAASSEGSLGKECINLMLLLSDLYNLKVVSCLLIYDIVREILNNEMGELDVELLLKLVKGSGSQLRTDDPSALKDITQLVHTQLKDDTLGSRTRFMLEVLDDLKTGKTKRHLATSINQSTERISKFVAGMSKKRHVTSHEPLRVSLNDLRDADTKGKWWLVGAAWRGNPLVDRLESRKPEPDTTTTNPENDLLKLARKQGMNTDIRRSIFVTIMSSDDYVDACERLALLNLTDVQQREILRVLVHCCGNENPYNPYYTLIGQQLCQQSHNHRITLQYCLWDFLRNIGETSLGGSLDEDQAKEFDNTSTSKRRVLNVAKAYGWWVGKDLLPITILKPLDFTNLHRKTSEFLYELFVQVFLSAHEGSRVSDSDISKIAHARKSQNLENIMTKASRNPGLVVGLIRFFASWKKERDEESYAEHLAWSRTVVRDSLQRLVEQTVD